MKQRGKISRYIYFVNIFLYVNVDLKSLFSSPLSLVWQSALKNMDFCRAGHGREVVSLCPRSRIKNEHRFGMFAVEMHWKTLRPPTRGLHLGSVETDHLRSDIWQSSLKAIPEIQLLFWGESQDARLATGTTSVCDVIAMAAEKADEDPNGITGIRLQVIS